MQSIPILDIENTTQLLNALQDFLDKSEATFVMVIDRGGSVLVQEGSLPEGNEATIVAALAAGSFAATKELALRIGEAEFSALHQQGKTAQILMSAVDEDTVMVTVFGPQTTQGLVRFYSTNAIKRIAGVLDAARHNQTVEPVFSVRDLNTSQPIFGR